MELPTVNLKAIVLTHWLLTVWGCMAWMPQSYAWGNFSVLALGVWAIAQRDSVDAVILFLVGLVMTILTDVIHVSVFYVDRNVSDFFRFSAGMAILSLILKPFSCFFVYFMYRERGGEVHLPFVSSTDLESSTDSRFTCDSMDSRAPPAAGFPIVAQDRSAYQSIDQQEAPMEQEGKMPPHQY
ncbi:type-1 angiotensin II receptor-associated protein isoform X1 [Ambystoma mexicanum]|uniref:type-1 angiotensin II receptor-associated protein isoform X1 n=1 Tax=Ambystoma mexicanum TaxID=8296 RepID=UPI0037E7B3F1